MSPVVVDRSRLVKGRTAAVLYGSGATVGLLAVLLPHWPTMRPLGILVPVVMAYAVTGVLLLVPRRMPDWSFHCIPVAGASLITVALLSTGNEAGGSALATLYVFPTLYSASVFSRRQAAVHGSWVALCYASALVVMPGGAPLVRWTSTVGACIGAGAMAAWLVSKRDRAEEALREGEASFRLLFANNPQPMWVYDLDTLEFLEVNDAAVHHYGWTREEFLRMRITQIRPPGEVERLLEQLRRERSDFEASGQWRHLLADGTEIDVEIRSHRLTFRGTPAAVVVAEDVTERKRAEIVLREAYVREHEAADRLRALDDTKNGILQAVSHELRTPLAVVLGAALTLRDRGEQLSAAMARDLIDRLAANARRLERLLSGILDLDRVTRGILEPSRQPTDVVELARRVARECDLRRVKIEVEPGSVVVPIDAAKVERIVENLLVNAERHTPAGTTVWLRAVADGDGVLLTVEDAGPGVPDELKPFVFDAFRHGGPAHSPGTGIGLSLVAQFAKLHGGHAWVEDRAGGGAAFKVLLPAA